MESVAMRCARWSGAAWWTAVVLTAVTGPGCTRAPQSVAPSTVVLIVEREALRKLGYLE